jgi:hypothetical protein
MTIAAASDDVPRLYEVPVSDYESWRNMRGDLLKIPGVIRVAESYGYGFKPDLK